MRTQTRGENQIVSQSLLTSSSMDRYSAGRGIHAGDQDVPWKWRWVLELTLSGHTRDEVLELTNLSTATYYRILADERIRAIKQQMLIGLDARFEALYSKVVDAIEDGLDPGNDKRLRLMAARMYLNEMGRGHSAKKGKEGDTYNITAEDVVFQILNGNADNPRLHQGEGDPMRPANRIDAGSHGDRNLISYRGQDGEAGTV